MNAQNAERRRAPAERDLHARMRPLARYQASQAEHEVFVEGLLLEARLRARILVRPDRLPPLMVKARLRQLPGTGSVFFGVSVEAYCSRSRATTPAKAKREMFVEGLLLETRLRARILVRPAQASS